MIKKIAFGGLANLIFILVAMFGNIVKTSLAVRYFPNFEVGIWFIFLNIVVIVNFCDFGLNSTLSREIGFASKKKDQSLRISNLFFTTRFLISAISLITCFFLFCFGYFYFYHLSMPSNQMRELLLAFTLFSIAIIIQFQSNPYLAVIYGKGYVSTERYIRIVSTIVGLLVSIYLIIWQKYGLFGLVDGYLCQSLFGYFVTRYIFQRAIKLKKIGSYLKVVAKRIFKSSIQVAILNIGTILIFQISNFVIAYLMGIDYVAQFAILFQIIFLIITFGGISGWVIAPFVSQARGLNENSKINYYFSLSVRLSTAVAVTLAIFLYFFIQPILHIWLGPNIIFNQNTFIILLVVAILGVHHSACAMIAIATGYLKFAFIEIASGILNLILSFVFIYFFGIFGAALAIFLSQLLTCNWSFIVISLKRLKYSYKKYFFGIVAPLLLYFIYLCLALLVIHRIVVIDNLYLQLAMVVVFTCFIAIFGAWIMLLSVDEKILIKAKTIYYFRS